MDNAWEQEKLEARKILENAAKSHTSGARFVGQRLWDAILISERHILLLNIASAFRTLESDRIRQS